MPRVLPVLLAALSLAFSGCDTLEPPLSDNSFRMRVDGEDVTGRAVFEANEDTVDEAEITIRAEPGILYIRSDALLAPTLGAPFAPSVGSYYGSSRGPGSYYGYEQGDVRVTGATADALEGEFDLVLEATFAFVLKDRVRLRGTFRVNR